MIRIGKTRTLSSCWRRWFQAAIVGTFLANAAHGQPGPDPSAIQVLAFDGAFNLPVWIGQREGFFAKNGIDVHLSYVGGSVELMRRLNDGTAQLALTSVDNVAAYSAGAGESGAPDSADVVAIFGGDRGFLSLVAKPGITRIDQLAGHTVSVDAMTTGFAFALRQTLVDAGLDLNTITFSAAGGTANRYRDLMLGNHDATLLRPPFQYMAREKGFHIVRQVSESMPHYLGTVGAARTSWAQTHQPILIGFLKSYRASLDWIFAAAHAAQCIALVREHYPSLTAGAARDTYRSMVSPVHGLIRDMRIDRSDLQTVLSLRARYAPAASDTSPSRAIVDEQYLNAAHGS